MQYNQVQRKCNSSAVAEEGRDCERTPRRRNDLNGTLRDPKDCSSQWCGRRGANRDEEESCGQRDAHAKSGRPERARLDVRTGRCSPFCVAGVQAVRTCRTSLPWDGRLLVFLFKGRSRIRTKGIGWSSAAQGLRQWPAPGSSCHIHTYSCHILKQIPDNIISSVNILVCSSKRDGLCFCFLNRFEYKLLLDSWIS